MCLILLAWRAHPEYPLVFAANRDEAYERPSATADFWQDEPRIFGGRDLEKGGTWLGLTRAGRIAAVTNYRDALAARNAPRSRGELVARYLGGIDEPRAYLERVMSSAGEYGAFSLIVGNLERLVFCSNRSGGPSTGPSTELSTGSGQGIEELAPGVHGLSNHLLDTPWPKVKRGRERVAALLEAGEAKLIRGLFDIVTDRTVAADAELPDTGVGLQRERELSAAFVAGDRYGTRASTALLINREHEVVFIERAFGARGTPLGSIERRFSLELLTSDQKSSQEMPSPPVGGRGLG